MDFDKIIVVGCGGTGSLLVDGLCRLMVGTRLPLILVDYDRVEPRNLLRQNFYKGDLGKFKSKVLAERYARIYGFKIGYSVLPFDPVATRNKDSDLRTMLNTKALIIGCVDNAQARRDISVALDKNIAVWWLDSGNGFNSGQVLLGNYNRSEFLCESFRPAENKVTRLPSPALQQPSLIQLQGGGRRRNCAEDVANNEQSQVINQAMATLLLEFVRRMFHNQLSWMSAYIDLDAGSLRTVEATPQVFALMLGGNEDLYIHHPEVVKEKVKVRV